VVEPEINKFIIFLNGNNKNCLFRLPTEFEWEYAAKEGNKYADSNFLFSGSNTIEDVGWYSENSLNSIHDVGLLKPNALGIYDMTGNAGELCSSWYQPFADSDPCSVDPNGIGKSVVRGGCCLDPINNCLVSSRSYQTGRAGFRLVMEKR
jgi:formylglycine-generating enzyme required for sulfatase activity